MHNLIEKHLYLPIGSECTAQKDDTERLAAVHYTAEHYTAEHHCTSLPPSTHSTVT